MQAPHLQPGFSLPPVKVSAVQQCYLEPHGLVNSHAKPFTNEQTIFPLICEDFWGVATGYIYHIKIFNISELVIYHSREVGYGRQSIHKTTGSPTYHAMYTLGPETLSPLCCIFEKFRVISPFESTHFNQLYYKDLEKQNSKTYYYLLLLTLVKVLSSWKGKRERRNGLLFPTGEQHTQDREGITHL